MFFSEKVTKKARSNEMEEEMETKFIFITGGVLSGLGKGQPELRQFVFVMMTYILAVFMGLAVQIGGGIDG